VSLRRFPSLAAFSDAELIELESAMTKSDVSAGHVFMREGETDGRPTLYAMVRGQAMITRGEELRFGLEEGALFGLVAFVDEGPRTATVSAATDATVLGLSRDDVARLSPRVAAKLEIVMATQLSRDFAAMNSRVVDAYAATSRDEVPHPEAEWVTIHSYSGLHALRTELHHPRSVRDIVSTLVKARKQGRRVAVRGSGLSFDTQAMHSDLTINLDGFDEVRIDPEARTMTAGASARWGDVVAKLEPHGLVPGNVVSGREITVGGTVSVNAMSRFTPVWGKEGKWVESLEVLTVNGERLTVSRTKEPDLFHAVVGGFGQAAIVLSATYRLQKVGAPVRVQSLIERYSTGDKIAPALTIPIDPRPDAQTSYAVVAFKGDEIRSIITRSRYVNDVPLRVCLPHKASSITRVPIELAIHHFQSMGQAFWNFAFERYLDEKPYIDELGGYTFFMDGNLRTKRAAENVGIPFRTVQETYVIPKAEQLEPFIVKSRAMTEAAGLDLSLVDILYLPEDEPFAMSSSYGLGGYAVTLTFEGLESIHHVGLARELMVDLATESLALGGRVHLTKNVFVRAGELSRMYAKGIEKMRAVKRRFDPFGLLTSDFVERLFPEIGVRD